MESTIWFKTTGSPSSAGHPFSSLNPDADIFVPRNFNTVSISTSNDQSYGSAIPPPFPTQQSSNHVQGSFPVPVPTTNLEVISNFSENTSHQLYVPDKPSHISQYPVNNFQNYAPECEYPLKYQNDKGYQSIQPETIFHNFSNENVPLPQTKELASDREALIPDQHNSTSSWNVESDQSSERHVDHNLQHRNNPRGRGRGNLMLNNYRRGERGSFRGTTSRYTNESERRTNFGRHQDDKFHSLQNINDDKGKSRDTHTVENRHPNWNPREVREETGDNYRKWNRESENQQSFRTSRNNGSQEREDWRVKGNKITNVAHESNESGNQSRGFVSGRPNQRSSQRYQNVFENGDKINRRPDGKGVKEFEPTMGNRGIRRGTYQNMRGNDRPRQRNYEEHRFEKAPYRGHQNKFRTYDRAQRDCSNPKDEFEIVHDESSKDSSDDYHITDYDSNDNSNAALPQVDDGSNDQCQDVAGMRAVKQHTSWADDVLEESQETTMSKEEYKDNPSWKNDTRNTIAGQNGEDKKLYNQDHTSQATNSYNNSCLSTKPFEKKSTDSRTQIDKNNTRYLDESSSLTDMLRDEELSKRSKKLFDNETLAIKQNEENVKENREKGTKSKPSIEIHKYSDPRMERERHKIDRAFFQQEHSTAGTKSGLSDGNYKQMRITSYYEPNTDKVIWEKEFDLWEKHWGEIEDFKVIHEVEDDLFEQPKHYSLAHCVAEDLRMGSGIAVAFKREFKKLPDLLDQRAKQGGLATLHDEENNRFVYYLITKKESNGKPTYLTLWKSLWKMREHIKENNVKQIAIPRLACGLDRLEWDKVKSMIECLFKEIDIEIKVCNFQQNEQFEEKKSKCKLVFEDSPITKIAAGTLILYLATSEDYQDDIIRHLSKKFNFWPSFEEAKSKDLGDIVYYDDKIQNFGLCGCIVRRNNVDQISFKSMHKCIQKLNKLNKQFGNDAFEYVALQWVDENAYFDDLINQKIISMLTGFLRNVDVYVCRGSFEDEGD